MLPSQNCIFGYVWKSSKNWLSDLIGTRIGCVLICRSFCRFDVDPVGRPRRKEEKSILRGGNMNWAVNTFDYFEWTLTRFPEIQSKREVSRFGRAERPAVAAEPAIHTERNNFTEDLCCYVAMLGHFFLPSLTRCSRARCCSLLHHAGAFEVGEAEPIESVCRLRRFGQDALWWLNPGAWSHPLLRGRRPFAKWVGRSVDELRGPVACEFAGIAGLLPEDRTLTW